MPPRQRKKPFQTKTTRTRHDGERLHTKKQGCKGLKQHSFPGFHHLDFLQFFHFLFFIIIIIFQNILFFRRYIKAPIARFSLRWSFFQDIFYFLGFFRIRYDFFGFFSRSQNMYKKFSNKNLLGIELLEVKHLDRLSELFPQVQKVGKCWIQMQQ